MVVLRVTAPLLRYLPLAPEPAPPPSSTRLGDWYATRLAVRHERLVVAVSAHSLLAVALPLAPARTLLARWADAVGARLATLAVPPAAGAAEVAALTPVVLGRTGDRRIGGSLTDCVFQLRYWLDSHPAAATAGWQAAEWIALVAALTDEMPYSLLGSRAPLETAERLLAGA
jgi:hypothetical protein